MQISLDTAKKLNWLWKDENKIEWIQTFIKIADKDGNIVPFILTDEQRKLVENLAHQNIISKSRQLGISVVTVALSIRACVVNPNTNCVLISHNQSSTNAVFDKLKQQFYSLPDWLRPKLIQNNRQALTFENGSSIVCMTAGNKDCGRGSTYSGGIVHLSEFAFWKDQQRQLKSIMQAVTSSSTVIIESTSNGYNEYSNLFLQARNGENAFKPFFFNWINGRSLFKLQYDESVKLYKAQHDDIAVNDAREWFDKGMVGIVSNYLLEEMKTFVAEENGSFNAVIGSHDDLVSAMWLCIQGFKNGFWYPF